MVHWTLPGSGSFPIFGTTHMPTPTQGAPHALAVVVHGFTGTKDRNIVPAVAAGLAERGVLVHRFTMSHAGVEKDADEITRLDDFAQDSLAHCLADVRTVLSAIAAGDIPGKSVRDARGPTVLIGHSRGGATALGAAARSQGEDWPVTPDAVVSMSGLSTYWPVTEAVQHALDTTGYFEREVGRAQGGVVRMGPSWFEHARENTSPDQDVFMEDVAQVACPVLLVHGKEDVNVPSSHAARVATALTSGACPDVQLRLINDGDHNFNALGFGIDHSNIRAPAALQAVDEIAQFISAQTSARRS